MGGSSALPRGGSKGKRCIESDEVKLSQHVYIIYIMRAAAGSDEDGRASLAGPRFRGLSRFHQTSNRGPG